MESGFINTENLFDTQFLLSRSLSSFYKSRPKNGYKDKMSYVYEDKTCYVMNSFLFDADIRLIRCRVHIGAVITALIETVISVLGSHRTSRSAIALGLSENKFVLAIIAKKALRVSCQIGARGR